MLSLRIKKPPGEKEEITLQGRGNKNGLCKGLTVLPSSPCCPPGFCLFSAPQLPSLYVWTIYRLEQGSQSPPYGSRAEGGFRRVTEWYPNNHYKPNTHNNPLIHINRTLITKYG